MTAPTPSAAPDPTPAPAAPAAPPAPALAPEPAPPAPDPAPPAPSWRDRLPTELRGQPALQSFADEGALAKSYLDLSRKIGQKGVLLPKPNDPADQARFYGELGRPETADKYNPGEIPARGEAGWPKETEAKIAQAAFDAGLSNDQWKAVVGAFATANASDMEALEATARAAHDETMQGLRQKWGSAFEEKMASSRRLFAKAFGGQEQSDALAALSLADGSRLGDHPAIVELFARLPELIREDVLTGDKQTQHFGMTPAEAQLELAKMTADPEQQKALLTARHPMHQHVLNRRNELLAMAKGGGPT